ncbi:MAG: transglutaminase family protein [Gemmatimonadota bacterium]|nr:transglutaminase family protein [Gemmatimonadota bacterium]MDH3423728.1 transglutaminase family protein [Gemmatimonadota bacterium]
MSNAPAVTADPAAQGAGSRRYSVTHTTTYRYASPVTKSSHLFRLRPVQDRFQEVLEYSLSVSVPGRSRDFDDVFGNHVVQYEITEPYTDLIIEATSVVCVHAKAGLAAPNQMPRPSIPIPWMPWQSQMMMPYLLPPELDESELHELAAYAKSFVIRNSHDLIYTLLDMTRTLNFELEYQPGSTQLETTPFEVFKGRRGVCQDFANLLICIARLEHVPARYRVGYIHTGGDYANKIQAEASHAWTEAYLPFQGWKGLDPTNGVPVGLDHIRVATGRNYRDATPTSGVVTGGAGETLDVSVRVDALDGN